MSLSVHASTGEENSRLVARVSGRVSDEATGEPVAGATVELRTDESPQPAPVVTGSDGAFRCEGVEGRDYIATARAPGYAPTSDSVALGSTGMETGAVRGRVFDGSTGDPIPNATVRLGDGSRNRTETVVTGSGGTFRFGGAITTGRDVTVTAEGYRARSYHAVSDTPGLGGRFDFRMLLRPTLLEETRRRAPLREWAAALLTMSVLLWVGHGRWRQTRRPVVGPGVRALVGCLGGLVIGIPVAALACAGARAVGGRLPPLPTGSLWLARLSASYALLPVAALSAVGIGFAVGVATSIVLVPARSAFVAGCGGLAAGITACYSPSGNGLAALQKMLWMMEAAADRRTLGVYMAVVLVGGVLVSASVGLGVSYAIAALDARRARHGTIAADSQVG
jgi:hypothetical protein